MLNYLRVLGAGETDPSASVRAFLGTRGFRELPVSGSATMQFQRSTQVATFFAFDPSRWRIDLTIDPRTRSIQMFVHTNGQIVTPRERHYFATFLDELVGVMASETHTPRDALALWGEDAPSTQVARAALNENVGITFGFFVLMPALIALLHWVIAVPFFWATLWGLVGSIALSYAWLFSAKNRQPGALPSPDDA